VHDSTLRVASRVRLRTSSTRPIARRTLVVTVRNADAAPMPESPGHVIRVTVDAGTCPPALITGAPDFDPHQAGAQSALMVEGGRQRRARIALQADARTMAPPLRCALHIAAIGPGDDPTPADNVAEVPVEIR
jgi:hypothetical protein